MIEKEIVELWEVQSLAHPGGQMQFSALVSHLEEQLRSKRLTKLVSQLQVNPPVIRLQLVPQFAQKIIKTY